MLVKVKNKVTGLVTLLPEKYLKFNKNFKKATKADLKEQSLPEAAVEAEPNVATEDNKNG